MTATLGSANNGAVAAACAGLGRIGLVWGQSCTQPGLYVHVEVRDGYLGQECGKGGRDVSCGSVGLCLSSLTQCSQVQEAPGGAF